MVKKYLKFKGVEFKEVNVDEDPTLTRGWLMQEFHTTTVPVITHANEIVIGYKLPLLSEMIAGMDD